MAQDTSATPERDTDIAVKKAARVILVGLDGSRTSWDAFAWAAGAAARGNGRLVAVHVMPFTEPGAVFCVPFDYASMRTTRQAIADDLNDEAQRRAREVGVSVTFLAEQGEVTEVVTEVARALHADLVVVGRSTKLLHRIVGSLSQRLIRRKDTPVVVVVP